MKPLYFLLLLPFCALAEEKPLVPTVQEWAALVDLKNPKHKEAAEKYADKPVKLSGSLSHKGGRVQGIPQDFFQITIGNSAAIIRWNEKAVDVSALRKKLISAPMQAAAYGYLSIKENDKRGTVTIELSGAVFKESDLTPKD